MRDGDGHPGTDALPRTRAALQAGVDRGLHRAAHVHVEQRGQVWSCGAGITTAGQAVDEATIFSWTCATKPILAIGLGVLADAGRLDVAQPLRTWLPEAPSHWGALTPIHLLTHTAGWDGDPGAWAAHLPTDDVLALLLADARLIEGWEPGTRAAYSVWTSWLLLGEVIQRLTDSPAAGWLERNVMEPAGLTDASLCLTPAAYDALVPRLALLQHTGAAEGAPYLLDQRPWCDRGWPGLSGRGPTKALAGIAGMLLADSRGRGPGVLRAPTARALITPWRVGMVDEATNVDHSWGLGLTVDRRAIHPRAADHAFGHAGIGSSVLTFADPGRDLVVALATDGIPRGLGAMARRFGVVQAIYRDVLEQAGGRPIPAEATPR